MGGCLLAAVGSCAEARGEEGAFFFFSLVLLFLCPFSANRTREKMIFSRALEKSIRCFSTRVVQMVRVSNGFLRSRRFGVLANYVRLYPSILSGRDLCYGGDVVSGGIPLSGLVDRGCN